MKQTRVLLALMIALPAASRGQTVEADLAKGKDAYVKSQLEQAKGLFASIISSKQQVTPAQKVTAFTYLGAYWALQGTAGTDSATQYFIAALDYDPFTTLDQAIFAADEQNAFARARRLYFKIGIRPIERPKVLDPQSTDADARSFTLRIVSTHTAQITTELINLRDSTQGRETFPSLGQNEGPRDIVWNGLINTVRADSGLYEFRVSAVDNLKPGPPIKETLKFRVEHVYSPLEDTLPSFTATDTLPSQRPGVVPILDGAKGLFIGGIAAALPILALSQKDNMSGWKSHFGLGVALGLGSGTAAAWYGATNRADGKAVAENKRRRDARAQFNAEVRRRNTERPAKTVLVIRPLTTGGG